MFPLCLLPLTLSPLTVPAPVPCSRGGDADGRAHVYDDHEDSVYGLAWSVADPWTFASLSYDGRGVVNKVPRNVKYKILI